MRWGGEEKIVHDNEVAAQGFMTCSDHREKIDSGI